MGCFVHVVIIVGEWGVGVTPRGPVARFVAPLRTIRNPVSRVILTGSGSSWIKKGMSAVAASAAHNHHESVRSERFGRALV